MRQVKDTRASSVRNGKEGFGKREDRPTAESASTETPNDHVSERTRTGGAYIPPARLALMRAQQLASLDKTSEPYQRITWDALKKSLNGLINKLNVSNLREIVAELIRENLIRGRGLFARGLLKAQILSGAAGFTPVYAACVAVVNTKLPIVGECLVQRLVLQFRRSFRRNDKVREHHLVPV